jgi:hypothetical protein
MNDLTKALVKKKWTSQAVACAKKQRRSVRNALRRERSASRFVNEVMWWTDTPQCGSYWNNIYLNG